MADITALKAELVEALINTATLQMWGKILNIK